MENIILDFWRCSLKCDFAEFDWDDAFNMYEPYLRQNVVEHGLGTFEEYKQNFDDMYGEDAAAISLENLGWCCTDPNNMWWQFSGYDALEAILKARWETAASYFENNVHGDLADLLERIQDENRRHLSEPKLIELFDECIHAQHASGDILEDVDIESLRDDAEAEWQEEQERKVKFPTKIRELRALPD